MTVYQATGAMTELQRNAVRLRASLPPDTARKCGGPCEGEAVEETVRQWTDGAWYDVVWIRCLNITPMTREVRHRLATERGIPAGKPVKCGWRKEISRVARPDLPAPTTPERKEQPVLQTAEQLEHTLDQIKTFVNLVEDQGWQIKKAAEAVGIPLQRAWGYLQQERQRKQAPPSQRQYLDDAGRLVDDRGAPVPEEAPSEDVAADAAPAAGEELPCTRCGGGGVKYRTGGKVCRDCVKALVTEGHKRRKGDDWRPGQPKKAPKQPSKPKAAPRGPQPKQMRLPSPSLRRAMQVDADDPVAEAVQLLGSMRARDLVAQPAHIERAIRELLAAWSEM